MCSVINKGIRSPTPNTRLGRSQGQHHSPLMVLEGPVKILRFQHVAQIGESTKFSRTFELSKISRFEVAAHPAHGSDQVMLKLSISSCCDAFSLSM